MSDLCRGRRAGSIPCHSPDVVTGRVTGRCRCCSCFETRSVTTGQHRSTAHSDRATAAPARHTPCRVPPSRRTSDTARGTAGSPHAAGARSIRRDSARDSGRDGGSGAAGRWSSRRTTDRRTTGNERRTADNGRPATRTACKQHRLNTVDSRLRPPRNYSQTTTAADGESQLDNNEVYSPRR